MITPRFMTGLLCATIMVGCGSVNTYKATVGKTDTKATYTSKINDVLSSFFLKAEAVRFADRCIQIEPHKTSLAHRCRQNKCRALGEYFDSCPRGR